MLAHCTALRLPQASLGAVSFPSQGKKLETQAGGTWALSIEHLRLQPAPQCPPPPSPSLSLCTWQVGPSSPGSVAEGWLYSCQLCEVPCKHTQTECRDKVHFTFLHKILCEKPGFGARTWMTASSEMCTNILREIPKNQSRPMRKQWLAVVTLPPSEHFGLKQLIVEGTW